MNSNVAKVLAGGIAFLFIERTYKKVTELKTTADRIEKISRNIDKNLIIVNDNIRKLGNNDIYVEKEEEAPANEETVNKPESDAKKVQQDLNELLDKFIKKYSLEKGEEEK